MAQTVKRLPTMWETQVRSLGWEDPLGEGNGNPLQYSCLENSKDGGAWRATVQGVAKSQTRLCKFTSLLGGRSYLYAAHGQVNTETPGQLEPEG